MTRTLADALKRLQRALDGEDVGFIVGRRDAIALAQAEQDEQIRDAVNEAALLESPIFQSKLQSETAPRDTTSSCHQMRETDDGQGDN